MSRRSFASRFGRTMLLIAVWLAGPPSLSAAVQSISLPPGLAAVALHPQSGDLAALATSEGQVYLFRAADLAAGNVGSAVKVRVGAWPSAICFKKFGDQEVFAVVCFRDAHMYLLDATSGELVRKIPLFRSGVTDVVASTNPNDPFTYYTYADSQGGGAGVVNLREMKDQGQVFDHYAICAVSASGRIAYRHASTSPRDLKSLEMASGFGEGKPTFAELHSTTVATTSIAPCVADPFDCFTAAGSSIYSSSLVKREAGLSFIPSCFFAKRPILIGMGGDPFPPGGNVQEIELRAASYNTFAPAGKKILLDLQNPRNGDASAEKLPRNAEERRFVTSSERRLAWVFADDARDRVVVVRKSQLFFVPLADFEVPEEPLLLTSLEGATRMDADEDHTLALKPLDDRVEIHIDALPEGMKATGRQLAWRPTLGQIGRAKIDVTAKHGEIQRSFTFAVDVTFPAVPLPFSPAGVKVHKDGKRAVIWEGPIIGPPGSAGNNPSSSSAEYRVAVVDLDAGTTLAVRNVGEPVHDALFAADYIAIRIGGSAPRCDLLNVSTLERAKALVAATPVVGIEASDKYLALHTQKGSELYEIGSLRRLKSVESQRFRGPNEPATGIVLTPQGVFMQGLLFDADLRPQLLLSPREMPVLEGADPQWRLGLWPDASAQTQGRRLLSLPREGEESVVDEQVMPNDKTKIAVSMRKADLRRLGREFENQREIEISLNATGDVNARQTLVLERHVVDHSRPQAYPRLSVSGDDAIVLFERSLYQWTIPRPTDATADATAPLAFAPRQSTMVADVAGKTVLKHVVTGGQKPYKFAVLTPYNAVSIDVATGDVTVDATGVVSEAERVMDAWVVRASIGRSCVDVLRSLAPSLATRTEEILGRRPKGVPVAVPIRVEVTDAATMRERLQYYVLIECSSTEALARLEKLDKEKEEKRAENNAGRSRSIPSRRGARDDDEVAELRRRVDRLEQRLESMTRQLDELLKKSDSK